MTAAAQLTEHQQPPSGNTATLLLAEVVGGPFLLTVVACVAFATILAVVAGIIAASATSLAHDIYATAITRGDASEKSEVLVARVAVVLIGVTATVLSLFVRDPVECLRRPDLLLASRAPVPRRVRELRRAPAERRLRGVPAAESRHRLPPRRVPARVAGLGPRHQGAGRGGVRRDRGARSRGRPRPGPLTSLFTALIRKEPARSARWGGLSAWTGQLFRDGKSVSQNSSGFLSSPRCFSSALSSTRRILPEMVFGRSANSRRRIRL